MPFIPSPRPGSARSLARDDERDRASNDLFRQRDRAVDEATRNAIIERLVALHLPLAKAVAARYRTQRDDQEDVLQVAYLGLVKAVLRYRPAVGAPFGAFALPTIAGEVRRHFRDHAWDVRPPRWVQELRPDVERSIERLTQELGRSPSVADIAHDLSVTEDAVVEVIGAGTRCLNAYSLDLPSDLQDGQPVSATLGELDRDLESVPDRASLRPLLAQLSVRDRQILVLRYVRGLTQRQIAEAVGLSQTQVCRLLERMLAELRSQLTGPSAGRSAARPPARQPRSPVHAIGA